MKYQTLMDYKMYAVPYCSKVSEDFWIAIKEFDKSCIRRINKTESFFSTILILLVILSYLCSVLYEFYIVRRFRQETRPNLTRFIIPCFYKLSIFLYLLPI